MKVSSGVLFIKDKKVLLAHAVYQNHWDIPKGQRERDEEYVETAIRECREEIGFEIFAENLLPIGVKKYNEKKDLVLYLYNGEEFPDVNRCKSITTKDAKGEEIPEMDDFRYVPFEELKDYCPKNLYAILKDIIEYYYRVEI